MKRLLILPFVLALNACTTTKSDNHSYSYVYQHNSNNNISPNKVNDYFEPEYQAPKRRDTEEVLFRQTTEESDQAYLQQLPTTKSRVSVTKPATCIPTPSLNQDGVPNGFYSGWGYVRVPTTRRSADGSTVVQNNTYYPAEAFGIGRH
jgi:hypothetical protein